MINANSAAHEILLVNILSADLTPQRWTVNLSAKEIKRTFCFSPTIYAAFKPCLSYITEETGLLKVLKPLLRIRKINFRFSLTETSIAIGRTR